MLCHDVKNKQDLAQDLPQDAVALELVLDRVREHDSTISDEQARTILVSNIVISSCLDTRGQRRKRHR